MTPRRLGTNKMQDCDELYARAVVTVVSTDDRTALVRSSGTSGCGTCGESNGCGTRSLMAVFGSKTSLLRVENTVGARAGDRVEIEVEQAKIIKMSALSYLLPLLGLIGGGIIGSALQFGDGIAFAGAMLGLVAGFVYSHRVYTSERWEREIAPLCVRRLPSQSEHFVDVEAIR